MQHTDRWGKSGVADAMKVHPDNKELVEYLQLNMESGPWVAGGACIEWFNGNQVVGAGDIDVWFADEYQYASTLQRLKKDGFRVKHESDNATTLYYDEYDYSDFMMSFSSELKVKKKLPKSFENVQVQLIKKKFFSDSKQVIDAFDFSVCKIATDGHQFLWGDNTISDLRFKRLSVDGKIRSDILKRMTKYIAYGFRPSDELIEQIRNTDVETDLIGDDYDF